MKKTTPWAKIKSEYLQGCTPKELAAKYKLTPKRISDKANKEKWTAQRAEISEKIREKAEDKVNRITNIALERLEGILESPFIKTADLINAIGKALEISGLKNESHKINIEDVIIKDDIDG